MNALGCEEIAGIIVTHLHHDHFGGIYAVQEAFGPDIPVWKSHVPDHWFRTYREIERRGLLKRCLREEDGELIFHPKRDLFATKNDDRERDNGAFPFASSTSNEEEGPMPPKIDGPEWDWLETELGYDAQQRQQLPFFFAFMKDARDFCDDLESGRFRWNELKDDLRIVTPDGRTTLRCVFTPGHASDHVALHLIEENALLSGDHVLGVGTTVVVSMYDYMMSLEKLLDIRPDTLCPGHGPRVENGTDLLMRYRRHRRAREVQVCSYLANRSYDDDDDRDASKPTSGDIARALYSNTETSKLTMATENVHKILHALLEEGLVCAYRRPAVVDGTWIKLPTKALGSPYARSQRPYHHTVHWSLNDSDGIARAILDERASLYGPSSETFPSASRRPRASL